MTKPKHEQWTPTIYDNLTDKNRALAYALLNFPNVPPYEMYMRYYPNCKTRNAADVALSRLRKNPDFQEYMRIAQASMHQITNAMGLDRNIAIDIMTDPKGNHAVSARAYLVQEALNLVDRNTKTVEMVKHTVDGQSYTAHEERALTPTERLKAIKTAFDLMTPASIDLNVSHEQVTIVRKDVSVIDMDELPDDNSGMVDGDNEWNI